MRNIVEFIALFLIGSLILIQRDVDGDLLINGWKGLAFANISIFVLALTRLWVRS